MTGVESKMKAEAHLAVGEYEKAVKAFKAAVKEDPHDAEAHFGLAEASSALADSSVTEVAASYRKAIDLDPGNIFYRTSYADFCMENGVFKAAEEQYLAVADLDRDNEHIYLADFAVSFKRWANEFPDRTGMAEDDVSRKALDYCLKALHLGREDAVRLLKP
ncbi:MAG: tetratricopeptide repeat protein [Thermoplasmata archaeon]|nr:tetratricopeptide repeat protein [Thermoplasmata archaeon]